MGRIPFERGSLSPSLTQLLLVVVLCVLPSQILAADRDLFEVSELTESDQRSLTQYREMASALTRRHVGPPLGSDPKRDIGTLQRLVDLDVLRADQTQELQSLGVALGDVLVQELGLRWVVLKDDLGRSRGLCLDGSEYYVFPITMISKRVEADAAVDVQALFDKIAGQVEAQKDR